MFGKLLIANRGEIACRIIRTAKRLNLRTVAVYSEADVCALHVEMADEAIALGAAPARESYLDVDKLIAATLKTGADAIHPGYGFLSENAAFAERLAAAGLIFVGPPAAAIRATGSKSEAKALMEKSGVPVLPGYHGAKQDEGTLAEAAQRIGYPVLLKAAAGGGGKGMRRVDRPADFAAALAGARREAKAAFGDDGMLVEKYLLSPRHVELQIFADSQGHALHLFDRDCSIQRRHQKVIEEAPAPGLSDALRRQMGEAAVAAARAVAYVGAGTVEFILDRDTQFFFMEMNTRLQVEHPVTEMITGLDLVEWQLRVAAGEPLPLSQEQVAARGHAIEARLYAEDPAREFLPSTGRLLHFHVPKASDHIRVDAGVRQGDEISIHYDPMLGKLIVWDRDREAACRRLGEALGEIEIVGLANNAAFLAAIARHPAFIAGEIDTGFIERHKESLFRESPVASDEALAAAILWLVGQERRKEAEAHSPWQTADGWRLNLEARREFHFLDAGRDRRVILGYGRAGMTLDFGQGARPASSWPVASDRLRVELGDRRLDATVVRRGRTLHVFIAGSEYRLDLADALAAAESIEAPSGSLTAPMPGRIVQLRISKGDRVKRGDTLLVLEAMKMEHSLLAPADGLVESIAFAAGDLVEEGVELLVLAIGEPA
ncbi:MAG TPA: acetyl-CoA carboxylase biotin carboxylase subunit [Candidatus Udaeobacter sp.]|nr:acetyl-CoA carboxylase biotin carboxylase subunit [Candidatus Udaeobacter sp.]